MHCSIAEAEQGRAEQSRGEGWVELRYSERHRERQRVEAKQNEAGCSRLHLRACLLGLELAVGRRLAAWTPALLTLNKHLIRRHDTRPPPQLECALHSFEFAPIKPDLEI